MATGTGEQYTLWLGRAAAAPTTPTDPENAANLHEIGELPDSFDFGATRALIEERDRNSPGQRLLHGGDHTEDISCNVTLDRTMNAAFDDYNGALRSTTQGVGTAGNIVYFGISNNVSGDMVIHGQAMPSQVSMTFPRQNMVTVSLAMGINGIATVTSHL